MKGWTLWVLSIGRRGASAAAMMMIWVLLVLTLVLPHHSSVFVRAQEVTYGSVLKLMHENTESRLHALDIRYKGGAPYHVVTGFKGVHNSNSYWIVKPLAGSSTQQGDPVPNGSTIRLQNLKTHNWLHSRSHASPLSRNLEVSCREGHDAGDTGDLWRLEVVDKSEIWMKDQKVRLKHVDTGSFLYSHEMTYTRMISGQLEICGVMDETADSIWIATEGVYLHVSKNLPGRSTPKDLSVHG